MLEGGAIDVLLPHCCALAIVMGRVESRSAATAGHETWDWEGLVASLTFTNHSIASSYMGCLTLYSSFHTVSAFKHNALIHGMPGMYSNCTACGAGWSLVGTLVVKQLA